MRTCILLKIVMILFFISGINHGLTASTNATKQCVREFETKFLSHSALSQHDIDTAKKMLIKINKSDPVSAQYLLLPNLIIQLKENNKTDQAEKVVQELAPQLNLSQRRIERLLRNTPLPTTQPIMAKTRNSVAIAEPQPILVQEQPTRFDIAQLQNTIHVQEDTIRILRQQLSDTNRIRQERDIFQLQANQLGSSLQTIQQRAAYEQRTMLTATQRDLDSMHSGLTSLQQQLQQTRLEKQRLVTEHEAMQHTIKDLQTAAQQTKNQLNQAKADASRARSETENVRAATKAMMASRAKVPQPAKPNPTPTAIPQPITKDPEVNAIVTTHSQNDLQPGHLFILYKIAKQWVVIEAERPSNGQTNFLITEPLNDDWQTQNIIKEHVVPLYNYLLGLPQ